jgi:hypothetical protein
VAGFVAKHVLAFARVVQSPSNGHHATLARRCGLVAVISRPIVPIFGTVGHEVSAPPIGMTMHWLPLTVIMRF